MKAIENKSPEVAIEILGISIARLTEHGEPLRDIWNLRRMIAAKSTEIGSNEGRGEIFFDGLSSVAIVDTRKCRQSG